MPKTRYRIVFREGKACCWRCMWNGPIFILPVKGSLIEASERRNPLQAS